MTKSDKNLIAEAYKQIYTESVNPNPLQQVVDLFVKQGWTSRLFKDGTGIAAKFAGESETPEHDIYFYLLKDNIHFYAHAKMPWDANIQENDVHIPIAGQDEYIVPLSELENGVKVAIDETLSVNLPEGPSEDEIQRFNNDERSRANDRPDREF